MKKLNKRQKLIILIATITVIVVVGIAIGANAMRTNIANSSYESSNSGSNNINLLPEYIKKGITLGGVTGTLEDLDTSDATATAQDILWGKTAYVKGQKVTGEMVSPKVGDYVNYVPDTASAYSLPRTVSGYTINQAINQNTSLTWRVLSVNDDGTIDITTSSPVSTSIYFSGALGYNNCVYVLNDLCASQYSNSSLGVTARSINLEDDIEPKMNETGIAARDSYGSGQTYAYGNVKTYTSSSARIYPNLYAQEKGSGIDTGVAREDGIAKNDSYYSSPTEEKSTQAGTSLTVTSDYYFFSSLSSSSYFDNTIWYNLVFDSSYWIASRCVFADSSQASFYVRRVNNGSLSYTALNGAGQSLRLLFPPRSFSWVWGANIWRRWKCRTSISAFGMSLSNSMIEKSILYLKKV